MVGFSIALYGLSMYREFKSDPIKLQASVNRVLITVGLYHKQPNPRQYVCMCYCICIYATYVCMYCMYVYINYTIKTLSLCMYVCMYVCMYRFYFYMTGVPINQTSL